MVVLTPGRSVRISLTVLAVLCGQVMASLLLLNGSAVDATAPPIPPWDDGPWLALPGPDLPPDAFEYLTGKSQEEAVDALGPPLRVRRETDLPFGCKQLYVYATRIAGERTSESLCISDEGRVTSFVGQGSHIDLGSMTGPGEAWFWAVAVWCLILGLPSALLIQFWHHVTSPRLKSRRTSACT